MYGPKITNFTIHDRGGRTNDCEEMKKGDNEKFYPEGFSSSDTTIFRGNPNVGSRW